MAGLPRVGLLPSSEAEVACLPRVGPLPSSEAEMWCVVEGLGGEASSEAEIALRVRGEASDGPYRGAGSWAECGLDLFGDLERIWVLWESRRSSMVFGCIVTMELSSLVASSSPGSPSSSPSPSDRRKTVSLGSV